MHVPVLLNEVIGLLDIQPEDIVLDCTINGGGHSEAICCKLLNSGVLIGMDQDRGALARAEERLNQCKAKVILKQENFRNLDRVLDELGIRKVNKILFDLGLSSDQLEFSHRGFSFKKDEPLLMTFKDNPDIEYDLTAAQIVNSWPEDRLVNILEKFGEERFAGKIAKAIVEKRKKEKIITTTTLSEIIESVKKKSKRDKIHPATKTFQALRIEVNDELEALKEGITNGFERLEEGGRMAVISFHGAEDRIVKNYFKKLKTENNIELINKKPIRPSADELSINPRARSAKLRAIKK